ncbi:protein disulfide-isomerase [Strigomonas culicis]|uniref:Protein disulfide-isomerase n=1 Tax=Strigomonas culicis TaxID=28005 RepID=S9V8B1_9TRYP|nr:protein disulfide-isomerase [Strigomonas culicis]|eukprot:EPY37043.1 protein disulfide-isomerase [Strigomonas culicis]
MAYEHGEKKRVYSRSLVLILQNKGFELFHRPRTGKLYTLLVARRKELERREPLDVILRRNVAVPRRVYLGNDHVITLLVLLRELLPLRLHLVAVPAPRRIEHDEHILGGILHNGVKVLRVELHHLSAGKHQHAKCHHQKYKSVHGGKKE